MKILLLAVITIVVSMCYLNAQEISKDFTVSSAEPYGVIDGEIKEYIPLSDGTAFMIKKRGAVVNIQKFDVNQMNEIARQSYNDFPKIYKFIDVLEFSNNVFVVYEVYNKKEKTITVFSRKINNSDATFNDPVELFKTSRNVVGLFGDVSWGVKSRNDRFLVEKSFDESKVMILYRLSPISTNDKKNYDEIGFFVFDNELKKAHGFEVKMPYTEAQMNNLAFALSSKGEIKMLAAQRERKTYEMFTINSTGELSVKDLGISTDRIAVQLEMQEDESGNFLCGGFYANGIEFKMTFTGSAFILNINGLLYFETDKDGNLIKNLNYDFDEEFIKQNLSEKEKKKMVGREEDGKAGILDLILTDFVIKEDGSIFFVGERQYVRREYFGPTQKYVSHYSNIVVIKIDAEGNLAWMKKLPKNQAGTEGEGQMSIAYMEGVGADYIAFVDNPKNINLDAEGGVPEAHKDGKGGFLTTYKVDHSTGAIEKHTICDLLNIDGKKAYQFKTTRIFRSSEGVFLMEIYLKGKKDTMVKFEIN